MKNKYAIFYKAAFKQLSAKDTPLNRLALEAIQHHIERAKQQENEPCDYLIDISRS